MPRLRRRRRCSRGTNGATQPRRERVSSVRAFREEGGRAQHGRCSNQSGRALAVHWAKASRRGSGNERGSAACLNTASTRIVRAIGSVQMGVGSGVVARGGSECRRGSIPVASGHALTSSGFAGAKSSQRPHRLRDRAMSKTSPPIIYTWTDEAPALATHALLPVIRAFAGATGVPVETRDISLAGRVSGGLVRSPAADHRVSDDLAELGRSSRPPRPTSSSCPTSAPRSTVEGVHRRAPGQGLPLPDYPDDRPATEQEASEGTL